MEFSRRQKTFDTYRTFYIKFKKRWTQQYSAEVVVVEILCNGKWETGTINTTNICENFIDIIAASFRLMIS